jgi:hypothetical protein
MVGHPLAPNGTGWVARPGGYSAPRATAARGAFAVQSGQVARLSWLLSSARGGTICGDIGRAVLSGRRGRPAEGGASNNRVRGLARNLAGPIPEGVVIEPECSRRVPWKIGKRCATYPANLCPIHRDGAASHSRRRTTILHTEGGHCKRFLRELTSKPREPVQTGLRGSLWYQQVERKEKRRAYPSTLSASSNGRPQ